MAEAVGAGEYSSPFVEAVVAEPVSHRALGSEVGAWEALVPAPGCGSSCRQAVGYIGYT